MNVDIRHAPSFAAARCSLSPGEQVRVEAGAMLATSMGLELDAKLEGGLMKSLRRGVLGGESLFITTYTAPEAGGWVDVAAALPGDMVTIDVTPDAAWFLERGNFVAAESGVDVDADWKGFTSLFGGEGGFMLRAEGQGTVIASSYGAMDSLSLAEGERVVVDSGHVVAFPETVEWDLQRAASGRTIQSLKSGEGFVFHFTGPGEIVTQTRNQQQLFNLIYDEIGSRE
jgi:uncharacterized protein (TIGR00266 family)